MRASAPRWGLGRTSLIAVAVGLVVTGALAWVTAAAATRTEHHLLHLQVQQAGSILAEAAPSIQTPMDTAVGIADATGGDVAKVSAYIGRDVGTKKGRLFPSFSLWRLTGSHARALMSLGQPSVLAGTPARIPAFLSSIAAPVRLAMTPVLAGTPPHWGFGVVGIGTHPRYAAYAEVRLPKARRATVPATSAFNDLHFALYAGRSARPAELLESTTASLPLQGTTDTTTVPFGAGSLTFVAVATRPITGALLADLQWIVAGAGIVLTACGVAVVEWLARRRRQAELLATENRRLYAEQRSISQSLQAALLPSDLPEIDGVAVSSAYVPGDERVDIGGDWYDVIACDERSFIFVVGDVSGRGVPAATTMARLHYAIRAYAAQGDAAEAILRKLNALLDVGRDGQFATVVIGHVDVPSRVATIASAGHPPPLVVGDGEGEFAPTATGMPVGVALGEYPTVQVTVPRGGALLAYTDGLIERRGELLDTGLARLRGAASTAGQEPGQLIDAVTAALLPEDLGDDVALLELRWTS